MSEHTTSIEVEIILETEKAYKLKNYEGNTAWFPKSQVSFKSRLGINALADIPDWLLEKNEW